MKFWRFRQNPKEVCPRCRQWKKPTRHHIYPKRFFHGSGPILKLCRCCHNEIEVIIDKAEGQPRQKLAKATYQKIADDFIS